MANSILPDELARSEEVRKGLSAGRRSARSSSSSTSASWRKATPCAKRPTSESGRL
jgi:hypothetical protein